MSYEVIPGQAMCSGSSTTPWLGLCNSSSDSGIRRRNFSQYSARSSATAPERPLGAVRGAVGWRTCLHYGGGGSRVSGRDSGAVSRHLP